MAEAPAPTAPATPVPQEYTDGVAALQKQDYAAAMRLFQAAAIKSYGPAEFGIGYLHASGLGVPQDYKQAMDWYKKAVANGDLRAETSIGYLHSSGLGVPQDYKEAMNHYQIAASHGEHTAEYNIGKLYEKGHGVTADVSEARKWMNLSATGGDEYAKRWLTAHPDTPSAAPPPPAAGRPAPPLSPGQAQNIEAQREAEQAASAHAAPTTAAPPSPMDKQIGDITKWLGVTAPNEVKSVQDSMTALGKISPEALNAFHNTLEKHLVNGALPKPGDPEREKAINEAKDKAIHADDTVNPNSEYGPPITIHDQKKGEEIAGYVDTATSASTKPAPAAAPPVPGKKPPVPHKHGVPNGNHETKNGDTFDESNHQENMRVQAYNAAHPAAPTTAPAAPTAAAPTTKEVPGYILGSPEQINYYGSTALTARTPDGQLIHYLPTKDGKPNGAIDDSGEIGQRRVQLMDERARASFRSDYPPTRIVVAGGEGGTLNVNGSQATVTPPVAAGATPNPGLASVQAQPMSGSTLPAQQAAARARTQEPRNGAPGLQPPVQMNGFYNADTDTPAASQKRQPKIPHPAAPTTPARS